MKPNDSCTLDVHISEDATGGVAHVIVWLYEKEDSLNKYRADYYFNKILSNTESEIIKLMIYPNPAANFFTIESNQDIFKIELISVLGKKVTSYNARPHGSYDISKLEDGLYFVKLISPNNKLIRTIRLQKCIFKP